MHTYNSQHKNERRERLIKYLRKTSKNCKEKKNEQGISRRKETKLKTVARENKRGKRKEMSGK